MATAEATREFSKDTKDLGDKIVGLTLKAAKELSDYLDEVHGIKPAAGGAVLLGDKPDPPRRLHRARCIPACLRRQSR